MELKLHLNKLSFYGYTIVKIKNLGDRRYCLNWGEVNQKYGIYFLLCLWYMEERYVSLEQLMGKEELDGNITDTDLLQKMFWGMWIIQFIILEG